jgi:cell division GTPase FtsZ
LRGLLTIRLVVKLASLGGLASMLDAVAKALKLSEGVESAIVIDTEKWSQVPQHLAINLALPIIEIQNYVGLAKIQEVILCMKFCIAL